MVLTSHISDAYDTFSSSCASFSLLKGLMTMTPKNQMTTFQDSGLLLVCLFCYVLNYTLIESFDCCLFKSYLVKSQYFQYFCSTFPAQNKFASFKFEIYNMFAISYIFAYSFNIKRMRHPIVPVHAHSDPVRVLFSGSDNTIELVTYILSLHRQVPEMYKLWRLNAQGFCEVRSFTPV